jgi:hypothetical protein
MEDKPMKIRPALFAGVVGSVLSFYTPLLSLLMVYISPILFISPSAIICRWCGFQFPIFCLVGILYAAIAGEPVDAKARNSMIRGAALTAFLVGLVGAFSEVIARIIPEIMVAVDIIDYTNIPLESPLILPITCIGFSIFAAFGAMAGAIGASVFRSIKSNKPAVKSQE